MRHNYKGRKLGTDFSHTKAMKKSLVCALFTNDRIKTIESRAKEIRSDADHIITLAKRGDLHARRQAIAKMGDKELVREVFEKVEQGLFGDRNGGYTRIMKLGPRKGDGAPMVIMELCTEPVAKKADSAPKAEAKKAARPKKAAKAKEADKKQDSEEATEATEVTPAEEVAEEAKVTEEAAKDAKGAEATAKDAEDATEEAAEDATEEAAEAPAEETSADEDAEAKAEEAAEKE